ncbi:MAG: hypothetical protein J6W64_07280 [Bacilli bacterium]|nr:hypothetical protein [Bacilli bacterium]
MSVVNGFTETTIMDQDNMHKILVYTNPNFLVLGATCSFAFLIEGIYLDHILELEFIFKDGIIPMFTKLLSNEEIQIVEEDYAKLLISTTLSADETSQFKFNRIAIAQLKFTLIDGTVVYSDLTQLITVPSIDK